MNGTLKAQEKQRPLLRNTEEKALVYSIQHYCMHDGPGIRTVVFFKGCHLHCGWCANPESQRPKQEIGYFHNKCRMCGACLTACKQQAIDLHAEHRIDHSKCTLCGDCVETCPNGAYELFGRPATREELMEQVVKDRPFYRKSGGGVTLSGGEPTEQFDFILNFLTRLKQAGIHTALETNGQFSADRLARLIPCTDLFLCDIKHMHSARHKQFTGVPNEPALENLYRIAVDDRSDLILRMPLIPGFNDDAENLEATARFSRELSERGHLLGVHLLGFHSMASSKYEALQRDYAYKQTPMYTAEQLERFADYFRAEQVPVQIGG